MEPKSLRAHWPITVNALRTTSSLVKLAVLLVHFVTMEHCFNVNVTAGPPWVQVYSVLFPRLSPMSSRQCVAVAPG